MGLLPNYNETKTDKCIKKRSLGELFEEKGTANNTIHV